MSLYISLVFLLAAIGASTVSSQRPRLVRGLLPHYTLAPSARFSECNFTGSQPLSVYWSYQGSRLPSAPSRGPYSTSEGVLVLENAGPADSGNYTCTGSNRLGTASVTTEITVQPEGSPSVARSWFMLFVYAVLVWLGLSVLLAVWMVCQHMLAQRRKPPPVDRNECFAIDHEGELVPELRPRSRVSGDYAVFGTGYPNPAFTGPPTTHSQGERAFHEVVNSRDGTRTVTTVTSQKEYYYIPPHESTPYKVDPKLQLLESDETVIT